MTAVYKYKVDWCDGCDQGWIEIKRSSINNNKIRFRCSECLTEYETYEDINIKALGELDWCPLEPSEEDILQHDLWKYIIKEWENYRLIRNDGVIIRVWSKKKENLSNRDILALPAYKEKQSRTFMPRLLFAKNPLFTVWELREF